MAPIFSGSQAKISEVEERARGRKKKKISGSQAKISEVEEKGGEEREKKSAPISFHSVDSIRKRCSPREKMSTHRIQT